MLALLQRLVRWALGVSFRITIYGLENIPAKGGALLVSNHSAVIDSYLVSAFAGRPVVFMSKKEHFESKGPMGWLTRFMVKRGAIPVDRQSTGSKGRAGLEMTKRLKDGQVCALHPEGTRTPAGAVYKAEPGFVAIARRAGVPVVPIALLGTERANPPGKKLPRPGRSITMIIGKPIHLPPDPDEDFAQKLLDNGGRTPVVRALKRGFRHLRDQATGETDAERRAREVMQVIAAIGGMPYIDISPDEAKCLATEKNTH